MLPSWLGADSPIVTGVIEAGERARQVASWSEYVAGLSRDAEAAMNPEGGRVIETDADGRIISDTGAGVPARVPRPFSLVRWVEENREALLVAGVALGAVLLLRRGGGR